MSELKAYQVICTDDIDRDEITENFSAPDFFAYDADEVDKVIAEKDKEIRKLKRTLYKACANWAMAESYSVLNDVPTANRWIRTLQKLKTKLEGIEI